MLATYGMIIAAFLVEDKANQVKFFKETFLVANVSPEVVLGMPFLTLSGADVNFLGHELRWRCKKEVARTRLGHMLLQGCSALLDRIS